MGHELLRWGGYDAEEPTQVSKEEAICGAAAWQYVINCGGHPDPSDEYEIQQIIDQANFNLVNADLSPVADKALVLHTLEVIRRAEEEQRNVS
ncbi:MAG TPA: hypothetical protein VGE30_01375 [Candidatus Saccharimonadales bacterium]